MCHLYVTGATGFIGQPLVHELLRRNIAVRIGARQPERIQLPGVEVVHHDLSQKPDFRSLLQGIDTVIHLAAYVHHRGDGNLETESRYHQLNYQATLDLAQAAARFGCHRFIFVSSVKVSGETTPGDPFRSSDPPAPVGAYACSKRDAEIGLHEIAQQQGLEVVVIRPPLVYGPGVGANFIRLVQLVARRIPLPLASIENQRSLIYVGNLVSALLACADNPLAAGKTYLVSDGPAVSTPELIQAIATALDIRASQWPAPRWVLLAAATLLRRRDDMIRLTESLVVDDTPIRHDLAWTPPFTMEAGLAETARWLHGEKTLCQ